MSSEEVLSRIADGLGEVFGAVGRRIERALTGMFGSSNARYLRKLQPLVAAVNAQEPNYQELTDGELREMTPKFRKRLAAGETLDDLLIEAFAVAREAGRRVLGMRHFDVQLMGGVVLHRGNIAEMVTGEGKTLVATLPAYLNALEGRGVHVVTVNDYLARRDMEWMGPLYMSLGLTVGAIQSQMDSGQRQKSYACDITYGTNNEFGFDYLRDNMRPAARGDKRYDAFYQQCQGPLHYAIIDEVDNILIDEARTPLIISGPAHDDVNRYAKADRIARQLHGVQEIKYQSMSDEEKRHVHFVINEKEHSAHMTDEGVREAEKLAGVESFYTAGHMEWPHLIDNSLRAHHLYKLDVNYVINGDEVVIVDEFTGRLMPGRNWSDGLHQAVEAKEAGRGARIKEENQTLATITLQNYFKLYNKICGMTGTAMTEAGEFWKIYKLDVIAIPTNKNLQRLNNPDVIYRSEREKYNAIVEEIERMHKYDALANNKGEEFLGRIVREDDKSVEFQPQGFKETEVIAREKIKELERRGRPILVGTVSIEKSEHLSRLLEQRGVPHEVLNAKHHQREAEIVAQAGRKNAVTIATNMAGRGTDIILGGNPEAMAWAQLKDKYPTRLEVPHDEWDKLVQEIEQREQMKAEGREVAAMGGLHIIGTERHEARRIDLQLRGRCGRQGDPGSSRFYLSLEDDLMRIFAGEWVKNILTRLGMKEGEAIISHMVSRRVEGAQKKVEERNFEIRKNLLEYDEVMDEQRKRVYRYRQNILDGARCKDLILEMIDQQADRYLDQFLGKDYGTSSFAEWAGARLAVELDAKDFRGMDFEGARQHALDQADRMIESQVLDALEENLPEDAEAGEWNWEALTKTANTRWKLSLRDRDLRQLGRDGVGEFLIEKARAAVEKTDLDDGARFLESDFGARTACNWVRQKFGIDIAPEYARGLEAEAFKDFVKEKAREAYDQREMEYPIQAGMTHFSARDATGHKHFDRDKLAEWAARRFETTLSVDNLKNKQREEIHAQLVRLSRDYAMGYPPALEEAAAWRQKIFPDDMPADQAFRSAQERGLLEELSQWLYKNYNYEWSPEEMRHLSPEQFERQLGVAVEEKYRPEMRRMERSLVLQILDEAWKNHLLVMDHLKSNIGLRGYAQVDPKVEYKREGMATFEEMWNSVGQRVTDLVFKIEQLDEGFVGSTWSEGEARHDEAPGTDIAAQQEAAIEGTEADRKPEPIRHQGPRVGRNDPCPCGSGKKFKQCCMRKGGGAA